MSQDPLRDIQESVAALFTADPYFAGIPILCERKGDLLNQLQAALSKLGICIIVETLTGTIEHQAVGAYALDLKVVVSITENVLINSGKTGTRKPASEVLARVLCLLNPMRSVPAWATSFDLASDSGGLLIYQITCKAAAGFTLTNTP